MSLIRLCKEHGYTFKKLSEETGISVTYLSRMNNGVYTNPTWEVINKIANALKISPIEVGYVISKEEIQ